jgi:hypothetical protein
MKNANSCRWFSLGCALAGAVLSTTTLAVTDPLQQGFAAPPDSARPRAWWHWMNGNVTKDGIAKDLAWMKPVSYTHLTLPTM